MLRGLRVNESESKFHLAYLEFELKYFEKIMMRREILNSKSVEFVDKQDAIMQDEKEKMPDGET